MNSQIFTTSSLEESLTLPTPRDWSARYGGCPWLDGGIDEQVHRLRQALESLQTSDGAHSTELADSEGNVRTIGWYSRRLGSTGLLVSSGKGHVKVSDYAAKWLSTDDDRILTGILHARILLFGEVLQLLHDKPGLTHRELREEATTKYRINWKTLDPVRKRVGWLRSLGYVQFSFDRKLSITETGREVLPLLQISQPRDFEGETAPPTLANVDLPVSIVQKLSGMSDADLAQRKSAFGYIPRSDVKDIYESIKHLCLFFDPDATKEDFVAFCASDFGLKETSGTSALYALRAMGLVEQFSMERFRLTVHARDWIDSEGRWSLLATVHSRILLVGELIPHLAEVIRVPDLRTTVNGMYGTQLSLSEIRSRIHLLFACSAVDQLAPGQFRATRHGLSFAGQIQLLAENEIPGEVLISAEPDFAPEALSNIRHEVTEAATDSRRPQRFEVAVQQCFEALGYHADHLGGPGKTDVLVHYPKGPGKTRRFIVDAKSSASGTVTETMVQFPALKDHLVKHGADFAVLVAPAFAGRVISWAAENSVVLLDLEHLTVLLQNQEQNPAPLSVVTPFLAGQDDSWSALETAWRTQQRATDLLVEVIDCLRREYENPDGETGGALTAEQIYFLLRDAVEPRPTQAAIRPLLDLLSSPLIQGTDSAGKGWVLPDPPIQIARRLRTLAGQIEAIVDSGSNS